jgi:uncharacterized repeat protein (TIGR02543 family)
MKISVKIISILVLLAAIAAIMACDTNTIPSEDSSNLPVTYTVAFRSQFNDPASITEIPDPTTKTVTTPATTIDSLPTPPSMKDPITNKPTYYFGGWYTAPDGHGDRFNENYPVNDLTTFNGKKTVYAYWYKYKVTYKSGTTDLAATMTTSPTVEALPAPPTRTGYTFVGWNTASNGSGIEFMANTDLTSIVDSDKSLIVYAQWFENTTPVTSIYAVTYNGNGGTDVGTQYVISPVTKVAALPANPTRLFYQFNSWNTKADGTGSTFDTSITVTENITVYAKWDSTPGCTVTYDSQGGTAVDPQYVIPSGTKVGTLPVPTKRCYSLAGWYKDTAYTIPFTADTTVSANITVYAQWTWDYPNPATYPLITPPFKVGDYGPSCVGKVFYIEEGSNGYSGLEAAPANWVVTGDPYAVWINGDPQVDETTTETYQRTQLTLNGNTSTAIGIVSGKEVGLTNSEAIMAQVEAVGGTTIPYAAKLCLDYSVGEGVYVSADWFLPSRDELAQLYATQDKTHWWGFAEDYYWTSSEYSAKNAWSQHFTTGEQIGTYKSYQRLVRPVRRFVVK